jgi:hypothetical protein
MKCHFRLRKPPFYPSNYEDSLFPTSYINSVTKYPKFSQESYFVRSNFINLRSRILAIQNSHHFPFIGAAAWLAVLLSTTLRRPDWEAIPRALRGSIFLLAQVLCASMMPVEKLPAAMFCTNCHQLR